MFVQQRRADGLRALVDTAGAGLDRLKAKGARDLAVAPVTLEDVFVALARED